MLTPHALTILIYATEELLTDASALESALMLAGSEELAVKLDSSIIGTGGDGADGIAKPSRLIDDPSLITIPKDSGQPAGTITATNVTAMVGRLWPYSHRDAVFVCSISPLSAILNSVELNSSGLLRLRGTGGASMAHRATLAGFPLIPTEQNLSAGTCGDLMLCDFGEYALGIQGLAGDCQFGRSAVPESRTRVQVCVSYRRP